MKKIMIAIACVLALGLTATNARADLVLGIVGDPYYLGRIDDSIPSSLALEAGYINYLITLNTGVGPVQLPPGTGEFYDRIGSILATPVGGFPTANTVGAYTSGDDPANTGIDLHGATYILGKYDADKAGGYVWYVVGVTDNVTIPATLPFSNKWGLSHYSLFNPTSVPDGGVTLMLLGVALVGLEVLRRRLLSA